MDSAYALIARGWGVSFVRRYLRVSRAHLHAILRRSDDWKDGRRSRHTDDTDLLLRIHYVIGELPTYGYHRVWALLRRQTQLNGMPAVNAKHVYRIMRQFARMLGLEPKSTTVWSPESNGIADSFVKTMKRDYISIMPKNLAEAFEHYKEWYPHSTLA